MGNLLNQLAERGDLVAVIAIVGGLGVGLVAIVTGAIRSMSGNRAREETRRELAAYVADGSLDADTVVRILSAAPASVDDCGTSAIVGLCCGAGKNHPAARHPRAAERSAS